MAVGAFDGAVLMSDTAIVARRGHAVMGAERVISAGQVGDVLGAARLRKAAERLSLRCSRGAPPRPEGVLQPLGESDVALAAQDDMGVLEAGPGQAEVIEPVVERGAGDDDAELVHIGEVGQAHRARLMGLAKDDLLLRPVQRAPGADTPLERPPDTRGEIGMPPAHLLEDPRP